ncbi:spore germination protein GerW family protein [uncultured Ilyobacter sp.]|uniref:GerW family sporulation protein n=2 Tax=uncultured Ilyobacter sp. TaxID=544433 RepID=UPI0029C02CCB|nr:spore germination protein GerW family protein [uncultured Ilyobacter sp.]
MSTKENIDQLFEKFENFIKNKTVIGEPFQIGDITLIPTLSISFGLGSGSEEKASSKKYGNGAGMGGRVMPIAMIVIKNGEISIIPIKKNTGLDKLVDMVPDLMDKIKEISPESFKKEKEE